MPAYRCHAVIREALDSVLDQTFTDREVVVVNDGCPETRELESVLTHYRNHILYMRRPHAGPAGARNTAMDFARGRYLAFLDADDVWAPAFLDRMVPMLERNRALDGVYCDGRIEGDSIPGRRFMDVFPSRGDVTLERVLDGHCTIFTSGLVVRAGRMREVGPFDESLALAEDYDLWLRLLLDGARFTYVRETLVRARLLPTRLCADVERAERAVLCVLEKLARRHDLTPARRDSVRAAQRRVMRSLERSRRRSNPLQGWMRGTVGA